MTIMTPPGPSLHDIFMTIMTTTGPSLQGRVVISDLVGESRSIIINCLSVHPSILPEIVAKNVKLLKHP